MRKAKPAPLPRWAPSEWLDLVGAIGSLFLSVLLECRAVYALWAGEGIWTLLVYWGAGAGALAFAGQMIDRHKRRKD